MACRSRRDGSGTALMLNRRGLVIIGGMLIGLAAMVSSGAGQAPPGAPPSSGAPPSAEAPPPAGGPPAVYAPLSAGGPPAAGASALGLPAFQAESEGQPLAVRAGFTPPTADGRAQLRITAQIQSGWHIYSITQAPGGPVAAKITIEPSSPARLLGPFQASPPPDKKEQPLFGKGFMAETHEGTVTWSAPIELPAGAEPGKLAIRGLLSAQACLGDERCEQREVPFTATLGANPPPAAAGPMPGPAGTSTGGLPASPGQPETTVAAGGIGLRQLGVLLTLAFIGGLILNVMPCVLPVISLKILSFLEQGGQSRGRVFALNVWYCVGLMSYFVLLAMLATAPALRLSWGEQFTLPWFKVALTALVFAMALSFLGVWEIPIPGFMGRGGVSAASGPGRGRRGVLQGRVRHVAGHAVQRTAAGPDLRPVARPAAAVGLWGLHRHGAGHGLPIPGAGRLPRAVAVPAQAGGVDGGRPAAHGLSAPGHRGVPVLYDGPAILRAHAGPAGRGVVWRLAGQAGPH